MSKPTQNRVGQQRGKFIVIEDTGGDYLKCRCECGRDEIRPREMFKPSYKGLLACTYCLGSRCEICDVIIPRKNRMPAKTCSTACAAERHRRIERQRYYEIKFTPEFIERQSKNRAAKRERMLHDAAFRELTQRVQRATLFMHRQRLKQDPARYAAALEKQREYNAAYLAAIKADPFLSLQKKARQRLYYRLVTRPKLYPDLY